jgi:MerR family transcriptional regulator, light-induced transcriptional regulator
MNDGRDGSAGIHSHQAGDLGCDYGPEPAPTRTRVASHDGPELRLAELAQIIERDIVPRLMLAHRTGPAGGAAVEDLSSVIPGVEDVADFASLVLERDTTYITSYLDSLHARGMPVETVLLQLLAPAARRLGMLWEDDLCDFTQVTIGLGRLHQLMWHLSPSTPAPAEGSDRGRRALLVPAPGEQHTLGICMVGDFFRRNGWNVAITNPNSIAEVSAQVRGQWFALVGLSLACERHLGALREAIRAIRRASRNDSIGVLVGGPAFYARPELVAEVGADGTARDGREAAEIAERQFAAVTRQD